jgi:NADPH:quinone reductase
MHGYITDPAAPGGLRLAEDLPEPQPAPNELLVDVRAYSINRGELFLLQQRANGWRPGQDLAGVVLRAAADGTGPAEGTRIVGVVDWECWAERVAVPSIQAAVLPDSVSFEKAASLPIAGLTALRGLRHAGSVLGKRVLVTGATGGVGQFAVQLAAASGAEVTAHVSSSDLESLVLSLGAHRAITGIEETSDRFDLVLDGIGGQVLTEAVHHLAPGGIAATYGTLGGAAHCGLLDFSRGPASTIVAVYHAYPLETRGEDLAVLVHLIDSGKLKPLLGFVQDWANTREAIEALRKRQVRGKAVLTRS